MSAYSHICLACDHPASLHGLLPDAESVHGPYRCHCGCEITQDSPLLPLNHDAWVDYEVTHRTTTQRASALLADAVMDDPALRDRFDLMARETEGREPVLDDFGWLKR